MADNPPPTPPPRPPSPNTGPLPKLPQTGLTGRLKSQTARLPIRTGSGGKIVVMLSSVAKPPPAGTQQLPRITPAAGATAKADAPSTPAPVAPTPAPAAPANPPPLPPKQVAPQDKPSSPQLSTTTYVKLPPKTTAPGWSALPSNPVASPAPAASTTPAPASTPAPVPPPKVAELIRTVEAKKAGAQHIPPIKLNEPTPTSASPAEDSIFLPKQSTAPAPTAPSATPAIAKTPMPITTTAPMVRPEPIAPVQAKPAPVTPAAPPVAKAPETKAPETKAPETKAPVETKAPAGEPVTLDLFEKSQAPLATPAPASTPSPVPEAKDKPAPTPEVKPAPLKAPPLMPPNLVTPPPASGGGLRPVRPPPLPPTVTKAMPSALTPPPVTGKPEKATEPVAEKLPPPSVAKPAETPVATPPEPPKPEIAPEAVEPKLLTPVAKPVEAPVVPGPLQVAPPMLEKAPEPAAAKLPPPLAKPVEAPVVPGPLHVAPPMLERTAEPIASKLPPPLAKPVEAPVVPGPLVHAPPLLGKAPEPTSEKLPPPNLPLTAPVAEARKADVPPGSPEPVSKPVQKVPAMIPSETATPQPSQPPKERRSITSWLKKTTPLVVSSSSAKTPAPIAEAKPALKPATLPSRSLLVPAPIVDPVVTPPDAPKVETPKPIEAKAPDNVSDKVSGKAASAPPPLAPSDKATPPLPGKAAVEAAAIGAPAAIVAALATDKKSKELPKESPKARAETEAKPPKLPPESNVPLTRAERAKKRRFYGLIFFWVLLFPATIAVLFWASLQVGRDTRLEGQVIPPPGTVLSNEVWIVTDFRSLASGITEDLAAERTPLMQEIQERQDHVQRAQADVASREERIRLIQEEIAAHKSEIESIVKQARDATQKVWDVDGAAIDNEYASRMASLKRTIADRAKSLNLKYQPDDTYDSPEVWANAYRLALYEVPAGVDGVKEHAWLSDQMKAWRDYQKSADDQKEALREKAAQIKLGPAPKITDLNSKIDELQQRIDATEAEEVPLKAELQQAQADLVTAQSADVGLDDKYYKQLYSLPGEAVIKRIPLQTNGRFTWLDDNVFLQGETQHSYYIFARATRADGRQYWSLGRISVEKNHVIPVVFEPTGFISTKAILRPTLSPDEIEQ